MSGTAPRFPALDVMRGLTIAFMIVVNTPGSWAHVYPPLLHAKWHGLTPTDLVFPFFLFIVGAALAFRPAGPLPLRRVLERTLTLFTLGLLLNAFPFVRQDWDFSTLRIMGVLQRIALCYGGTAWLAFRLPHRLSAVQAGLLGGYAALMWLAGGDAWSLQGNLARQLDLLLLGESHLYQGLGLPFDPEGLLSTLPALSTTLFGLQCAQSLRAAPPAQTQALLLRQATHALAGLALAWLIPLNKALWTPSYVLLSAGLAGSLLLLLHHGLNSWPKAWFWWPWQIYGTNSIFVFVFSGLWVKVLIRTSFTLENQPINGYNYLYQTVFLPLASPTNASLFFALAHGIGWWLVLYELNRRNIHLRV